jgi:hypothetical protein
METRYFVTCICQCSQYLGSAPKKAWAEDGKGAHHQSHVPYRCRDPALGWNLTNTSRHPRVAPSARRSGHQFGGRPVLMTARHSVFTRLRRLPTPARPLIKIFVSTRGLWSSARRGHYTISRWHDQACKQTHPEDRGKATLRRDAALRQGHHVRDRHQQRHREEDPRFRTRMLIEALGFMQLRAGATPDQPPDKTMDIPPFLLTITYRYSAVEQRPCVHNLVSYTLSRVSVQW